MMKKITFLITAFVISSIISNAQIDPGMTGLTGLYEFSDSEDMFANTSSSGAGSLYNPMCMGIMKYLPDPPSNDEDDQASEFGVDYFWSDGAIFMNAHNWFKIRHGIPANGGGTGVNEFTIVIDVKVTDAEGIYSLLEVNPTPSINGFTSEMEIVDMKVGTVGIPVSGEDPLGFSENTFAVDTWYRIVYAPDLNEYIKVYVDGVLWKSMFGDFTDAYPAPYGADDAGHEGAIKVGGNNEQYPANDPARDAYKEVSLVAVFDRTLSESEVLALGTYTTTIKNIQPEHTISIYPNPAADIVTISGIEQANIELLDIRGQVVYKTSNLNIDLRQFSQGVYLVKLITDDGKTYTEKLIVN